MKTAKDLADTLSVSEDTVQSWMRLFGEFAPPTVVEGVTVYPDRGEEVLRTIQQLDADGKSFSEIREELARQYSLGAAGSFAAAAAAAPKPAPAAEPAAQPAAEKTEPPKATPRDVAVTPRVPDTSLSMADPAVADAFRGIIHWMETAEVERKRTRRALVWLASSVISLIVFFVGLFGWVSYLIKQTRQETLAGTEEITRAQAEVLRSVSGYGDDVRQLNATVEKIRGSQAAVTAALEKQNQLYGKDSEKIDSAIGVLSSWQETEANRIAEALEELMYHLNNQMAVSAAMRSASPAAAGSPLHSQSAAPAAGSGPQVATGKSGGNSKGKHAAAGGAAERFAVPPGVRAAITENINADEPYVGPRNKDGKKDGKGRYMYPNGDVYDGDFSDGKKHGTGRYVFNNGDVYFGDYKDDVRTGKGTYVYASGDRYEGEFLEGKRNGRGVYTYPDGSRYVGEWKDGLKDGEGYFIDAQGKKYEGMWQQGQMLLPGSDAPAGQPAKEDAK
ncbi:MAG: MerR family transcriptional regulator [Kiritimatiellae bacterium]|nr:MerR family transcriptional regulator [Kiritimatiellia bacterium]